MTGIAILDVAIGLVFVYLLLGLLCTVVSEWIADARRLRARTLRQGIEALLADSKYRRVTETLYRHPLILGLRPGDRDPAYIPGVLFAKAFLAETERKLAAIGADLSTGGFLDNIDRIAEKYDQLRMEIYRKGQIVGQRIEEAGQVLDQLRQRERNLRKSGATPGELTTAETQLSTGENVTKNAQREHDDYVKDYLGYSGVLARKMAQIEAEQMCFRHVAEALRSFVSGADATVGELEQHLARWYEAAMSRVSGWYRKKLVAITLAVGAVAALVFNADTIAIARNIWVDNDVRSVIRRAADTSAQRCTLSEVRAGDNPGCSIEALVQTIEARRRIPLGWHADAMPLARSACPEGDVARRARDEARRIADDASRPTEERAEADARMRRAAVQLAGACSPRATDYLLWLFGLALSAVALSLAAVFWFDVLKRFVMMRTTGNPPPEI